MKFEQEHTLPMLAVHATWVAVQMGMINSKGKPMKLDKLLGKDDKDGGGQMSKGDMMANALILQEFHSKQMEKKKKEEGVS